MSLATNRLLLRLGRWPRRCAAAACLILAVGSLAGARTQHNPQAALGIAARLHADQVAVPVVVTTAANVIHDGDRVGLLASQGEDPTGAPLGAALIADHLRVLSVIDPPDGSDGTTVIVATDRKTATRIASAVGATVLAVVDSP